MTRSPTTCTSSTPSTSTPHKTTDAPRRIQAIEATRSTGDSTPSGTGTPQSPRQDRAAKRAPQRRLPTPQQHAATATREHQASPTRRGSLPSHRNTATTRSRPEQPLGTMRPQTSPRPGPAGDPGPQPLTPPDASTRGHSPAAPHRPTRGPTRTTTHQSDQRQAPHTHRQTALPLQLQDQPPNRHVPLPRSTPPAPGPSDPSAPCAPPPMSPPGAPVPRLQPHPARQPQGTIYQPRRRPNRRPINAKTHQPDRQYGP